MKTGMSSTIIDALSNLQVGIRNARSAAGEVAKLTTGSKVVQDTVRPLLKLQQSEQEVAVGSKVVQVENETLGRFVDETV